MIHTKLYLYDSNSVDYKGTDYSSHVLQGDQKTDDLTDVLDVVNLTLAGLTRASEFEPTTKFIYEKWYDVYDESGNAQQVLWKSWDIMVTEDLVSQPIISDDTYFDHQITFNEASVVAQGRIVDNIAVTYKLKDISLDTQIQIDETAKANVVLRSQTPSVMAKKESKLFWSKITFGRQLIWRFPNWFTGANAIYNSQESDWRDLDYYIGVKTDDTKPDYTDTTITLPIPMLEIRKPVANTMGYVHQGYTTITCVLERKNIFTKEIETFNVSGSFDSNKNEITINPMASSISQEEGTWVEDDFPYTFAEQNTHAGIIQNRLQLNWLTASDNFYFRKVIDNYDTTFNSNRKITLSYSAGTLLPNHEYSLKVIAWKGNTNYVMPELQQNINRVRDEVYNNAICFNYYGEQKLFWADNIGEYGNEANVIASISFVTYDEDNNKEIFTAQAPPQNAYELFVKAQLCSQTYEKVEGVSITDLSNIPFYVSAEDEQLLKNTQVVENFYNQKNLWEIFIDIGKYIHSIPRIKFGENDRFLVTFDKLGSTEQFENTARAITIFNSKNIENYISACSSYVSNMVQLGGVIDEWVAPKSSSEDYLVYNDVVEIMTSKPIIEIVDMEVKCINPTKYSIIGDTTRSMVENNGYIFEKNVYQCFSVDGSLALNKGRAIYYELGDNKIKGLNYQLPSISPGDAITEYAIKRILGLIFGISVGNWANILVNDFIFHIIYRTKDTVRTDQTRPDLRKYMLNTSLDRVPQHNQFNNQQDILVDSVKFGNNIYGKLIRTGNTEFTITEWVQDLGQLKQIGQLYNIRDNIYYVAKVENTYFVDHVTSVVTYSKDYNQLSEIIGIPSEPRFYEISEQSAINREVSIDDYLIVTTQEPTERYPNTYYFDYGLDYIAELLFTDKRTFPKYAITVFKNDIDHAYGNVAGNEKYYKEICSPINTYSVQNTLTMEWDMVDNFSAGDMVAQVDPSLMPSSYTTNEAYNTLAPVRYPDVYGRADLLDFYILGDLVDDNGNALLNEDVYKLPESPVSTILYYGFAYKTITGGDFTDQELTDLIVERTGRQPLVGDIIIVYQTIVDGVVTQYRFCEYTSNGWEQDVNTTPTIPTNRSKSILSYSNNLYFSNETQVATMGDNEHGIALMKDNREAISINYNLQMLTDSDRFVLSSYLWQPEKQNLYVMLLNQEINKISNDTIPTSAIIEGQKYPLSYSINYPFKFLSVPISTILANVDLTDVKAIVIASDNDFGSITYSGQKYFIMGRNITDLTEEDAKKDWYISKVNKDIFNKQ